MADLIHYQDFPLAHTQMSMWSAMQTMESNNSVFKVSMALEFNGLLDYPALQASLNHIVARHEALRTLYPVVDGTPVQRVFESGKVALRTQNTSVNLTPRHFIDQQLSEFLDPAVQVMRASLLKIKEDQHVFIIDIHHLSFDGWSMSIFAKELYRFYNAEHSKNHHSNRIFPSTDYQFVDWSEWRNNQAIDVEAANYWQDRTAVFTPPQAIHLALHDDDRSHSAMLHQQLNLALWRDIKETSQLSGITVFEWLICAWSFLISQYTHENALLIATPWANRDQPEFQDTMGCFIDTVPLHLDCSLGNFNEHLLKNSPCVRADLAHANYPSSATMSLLRKKAPSGTSWTPSTMLALQLPVPDINQWDDLYVKSIDISNSGAKHDLVLRIEPSSQEIAPNLVLEYCNAVFNEEQALAILNDILNTFNTLVKHPHIHKDALELIWNSNISEKTPEKPPIDLPKPLISDTLIDIGMLRKHWASILNRSQVEDDSDFFMLGGDSILAIRLVSKIRESGITCRARDIFENPTPLLFAKAIAHRQYKNNDVSDVAEHISADALLPIEKWFFDLNLSNPHLWAQAIRVKCTTAISAESIKEAINVVQSNYPAFGWRWLVGSDTTRIETNHSRNCHCIIDHSSEPIENLVAFGNSFIDLANGPTSVVIIKEGITLEFLYLIHHLCVDTVSWHLLVQDLQNYLHHHGRKKPLPDRRPALLQHAKNLTNAYQIDYWNQESSRLKNCRQLPGVYGKYADIFKHQRILNTDISQKIKVLQQSGILLDEIFLTALAHINPIGHIGLDLGVTLESHGRDPTDPDSGINVGWHTVLAPFIIRHDADDSLGQLLQVTEDLAQWKNHSPSWLACKGELANGSEILPTLSFNNLGNLDNSSESILSISSVTDLALYDPLGTRPFQHEVLLWSDANNFNLLWIADKSVETPLILGWLEQIEVHIENLFEAITLAGKKLPLSPLAEALLFHSEESGDNKSYIGQVRGWIDGRFDPLRFENAWNYLLERHPQLRSFFRRNKEGTLYCQAAPSAKIPVKMIDLSIVPAASLPELILASEKKEISQALDIGCAPLSKLLIIKVNQNKWKFAWTHHHAIVDGWSLPIILDELLEAYDHAQAITKKPPPTPESIFRCQVEKDLPSAALEWQQILVKRTDSRPLPLPLSGIYPDIDIDLKIAEQLTTAIHVVAASRGVTAGSWYQASWALVLKYLGAGSTPCFGTTVSGRDLPINGIDQYVGLLINTLPSVISINPDSPFTELVKQVHLQSAMIQNNAFTSLSALQKMVANEGEPLFDSLFIVENYPQSRSQGEYFQVSGIEMREQSHYPIALAILPGERTLLRLSLRTGRVPEKAGEHILALFKNVLQQTVLQPDTDCKNIQIPADPQKNTLMRYSSSPEAFAPLSIYELYTQAAAVFGEKIAVDDGITQFSYTELLHKSEQFASACHFHGVKKGNLISIISKRSIDLIAGIIGTSCLGSAFLTIDSELPIERILDLLKHSESDFLVLDEQCAVNIRGLCAAALPHLTIIGWIELTGQAPSFVAVKAHPAQLAYLVYTSGSTGNPKRVAISNQGIANFAFSQNEVVKNAPGDRVYQLSSPSFDAFFAEFCSALFFGATLCLPKDGNSLIHLNVIEELNKFKPTHIQITPSILNTLPIEALQHVRVLFVCGEKSFAQDLLRWRAKGRSIFNAYGPCENTVCASMFEWVSNDEPLLGHAMRGVNTYLLNQNLDLTAPGFIGQIYLSGPGLAWGYLGDPAQTAACFIPNPWSNIPGNRLYATGDLAIRNDFGELKYIGRIDHQVKINGQRVEIDEIENVLRNHLLCKQVHVRVVAEQSKNKLAAWLEPLNSGEINLRNTAAALLERLPPAMVPSLWSIVQEWPLNSSGKIDFKNLPQPHPLSYFSKQITQKPTADIQQVQCIIDLWSAIFGHDVQATDDLYSLGGDSITAMRLAARLSAEGFVVTAKDLLSGSSPIDIAEKLSAVKGSPNAQLNGPKLINAPHAPCSPIQFDFLTRHALQAPRWVLSVELIIADTVDLSFLRNLLADLTKKHAALKSTMNVENFIQTYDEHQTDHIFFTKDASLTQQIFRNARLSISATNGPGFVAAVTPGRLLLAAHHLWIDIVSLKIIVDDLNEALATGRVNKVPSPSYLTWVNALAQFTIKGGFDKQTDYWIRLFEHQNMLSKPLNSNVALESSVVKKAFLIPNALVIGKSNNTLEAAILQVIADIFASDTAPEILVEMEGHGRHALQHFEASSIVGWFTAAFPVRLKKNLADNLSLNHLLKMLQNIPSGGSGFLALKRWKAEVHHFSKKTDLSECCQIGFNFLGDLSDRPQAFKQSLSLTTPLVEGLDFDQNLPRPRPLTIESWLENDGLHVLLTCDPMALHSFELKVQEFKIRLHHYLEAFNEVPEDISDEILHAIFPSNQN